MNLLHFAGLLKFFAQKIYVMLKMCKKANVSAISVLRLALCVPALLGAGATAYAGSEYTVRQTGDNASALEITFSLPPGDGLAPRRLAARGVAWGLQEQVESPRCAGEAAPLVKDSEGHWIVPPGCRHVSWTVRPLAMQDGTADVSAQTTMSLAQSTWVLLSEPTSLLRMVEDSPGQGSLRPDDLRTGLIGATPAATGGWRVPAESNAPEFFVVGAPEIEQQRVGDFTIRYVADDWPRVHRLGLMSSHARALRDLTQIVYADAPVPESDRSLLVVWIGVDARHGHAGGAAGSRSFLANYLIGENENAPDHLATAFMILAHEQFHQLADARRGERPALPAWINESIAQYYGLRAMQSAIHDPVAAEKLTQRFIDPDRNVEQQFIGSETLFATDRPRALDLAYRHGATFWAELDRALRVASDGTSSLDEYIPDLLQMEFAEDGSLPAAFLEQLRGWNDERIVQVIVKYVGAVDGARMSGARTSVARTSGD